MPDAKVTKASVNYRDGHGKRRCANCGNFRPPDACQDVAGIIKPGALCDRFVSASRHNWYEKRD